jgi:hypothetical protein
LVNAPRLFRAFVDRQGQAAVLQFLVQVDGGGGEENRCRSLDAIFLRHHPARCGVLARRGDGEFAFTLKQLPGQFHGFDT